MGKRALFESGQEGQGVSAGGFPKTLEEMNQRDGDLQKVGTVKATNINIEFNRLVKLATLFQVRRAKEHKQLGLTWDEFCQRCGESKSSVDKALKDLRPIYESFNGNLQALFGMSFSQVRYLGQAINEEKAAIEDGAIVVEGARIVLSSENREEIQAVIDSMKDDHSRARAALEAENAKLKKHTERVQNEEIKALKIEKDALVKETQRLQSMVIEVDNTPEGFEKQMAAVEAASIKLAVEIQKIKKILEETDPEINVVARAEVKLNGAKKMIDMLYFEWNETFNMFAED
jgi:hypothetical protein